MSVSVILRQSVNVVLDNKNKTTRDKTIWRTEMGSVQLTPVFDFTSSTQATIPPGGSLAFYIFSLFMASEIRNSTVSISKFFSAIKQALS